MSPQNRNHSQLRVVAESHTDSHSGRLARRARRTAGILFGLGTHALFAVTVWHLFFFLRDGAAPLATTDSSWSPLLLNSSLALQFAVIHSFLLYPGIQRTLTRWIPKPFYGCFFCTATCLTLLIAISNWTRSETVVYDLRATPAEPFVHAAFYGSWLALFYSLNLSGLGYQTGWTPWWFWFRKQPLPRRVFEERGAYRFFRHPIYLSFLGLIWFTPLMTLDHAVLTGLWTIYIFVGSYLKDERLAFFLGDRYRDYQQRVPAYPLIDRLLLRRRTASRSSPIDDEAPAPHEPHLPQKAA